MTKSELISEILSEWAYRVDDGQPNPKNKKHLAELSIVLSEMGLSNIKNELFENLEEEDSKQFSNPLLNKKLKYKNEKGEDKEAPIGNLLRLPKGSPGRDAAEKMLPKDGSPERDALNKSLGGEKDGKSQATPDNTPKGGEDSQQEDPIQKAAVMFDPKVDPAMGARMDTERDNLAKLAQTDKEADAEEKADVTNKEEDGNFNPIPTQDVNSEMPQADPDTFGGNSDIPDGIQPEELHQFNTDIKKVAQIVAKAKENNQPIPNINLCDITVPGTNLYCDDNLGIPRDEMPQFKGKATPGSRAAAMDADESGEVDTEPVFKQMLQQKGIKTLQTEVPADKLKATQKDLVGGKVIGMMGALEKDPHHPKITAPIYVSRDGYVIDGHHRWAAIVAYNAQHPEQQIQMKTTVLDMDIKDAIPMCNQFAEDMGVAAKKADANKETPQEPKKQETIMKQESYSKYQHLLDEVINEIMDEAPVKKDPLEGKKVKYKDSKGREREILVKSALEYDKKHPAYIAAQAFLNKNKSTKQEPTPAAKKLGAGDFRKNPKEKPVAAKQPNPAKSEEPTKVNSIGDAIMANSKQKGDDKKQAFVDKKKDELNKLLGSMGEDNKLTLLTEPGGKSITINTLKLGGVIDKVFSGKPLNSEDKKLFNSCLKLVTNPENGDVKIYVAAKYVGRHPQQGYESIKIAQDNVAMGDAIRKYALQNNLNVGKSSEGAIGKKVLTPVKMAASVNPSKPETIVEIKKSANGVTIGGKEMKRLKELDYDGLVKSLTAKYGPEEASKKAKLLVLQTKAYNQKLDDLAKIGESSGGKIPMANFGDVTTPQNRKKTASNVLDGIIKRFESELDNFGKQFGKSDLKNTPENKKVFNSLNTLKALNAKANLETDEKARAQYKATLDQLLLDMANAPDFKDSVADFAEQKAGLQFLAEGKQVYFPASENFQTADIIVMPDEFSVKPKKGQTTEEAIAENLQFYSVTVTYVGGLSVKYKGGGGSANYSKIEQTEYHNPETKAKLLDMQNVYSLAYPKDKNGQLNIKDADVKAANKKIEDTIQWAIKAKLMTKEDADLIRRIGAGQAGNTLKGALKDVAKCKGANRKNFEQAIVLHHTMMHLTAVLNNKDMAYTRFSNFNEEVSQNKDGQATKITDDIADGVNKPCYMNPHHNPGFGTMTDATSGCITGSPTNQNPSHIESEQPKNLLKAPK
jgi:hypothetical protein